MAVQFLFMMALLQLGACDPVPGPDPENIVIQVSQEVNSGCGNGGCHPRPVCCRNGVDGTCRKKCESGEKDSGDGCEENGVECDYKCCVEVSSWPSPAPCLNNMCQKVYNGRMNYTKGICSGQPIQGWTDAGQGDMATDQHCQDYPRCKCYIPSDVCEEPQYCRSTPSEDDPSLVWGICLRSPPISSPPIIGLIPFGFGCAADCQCYLYVLPN